MGKTLIDKIKRLLSKHNITPTPGVTYIIYNCGHVCESLLDPKLVTYYAKQKHAVRSCSICKTQKLLTKYKLCICGKEHIGPRVQNSNNCSFCPPEDRSISVKINKKYQNQHLFDDTKTYCKYRLECCTIYEKYQTLPCKGCTKYEMEENNKQDIYMRSDYNPYIYVETVGD